MHGKDLLFIAGNEIGDLMYEPLIEILKSTGSKLELYSKSFLIVLPLKEQNQNSKYRYLCEYQTIHGSADDLIEENREEEILPYATLRIAADIIEKQFGIKDFGQLMNKAVAKVQLARLRKKIPSTLTATIVEIKKEIISLYNARS